MEQVFAFLLDHWVLCSSFVAMVLALSWNESKLAGLLLSPAQLGKRVNRDGAAIIDLRDQSEFKKGHIAGSQQVAFSQLKETLPTLGLDANKPLIFVCKMGQYSGAAAKIARSLGFAAVGRLDRGLSSWTGEGLPLVKDDLKNRITSKETSSKKANKGDGKYKKKKKSEA